MAGVWIPSCVRLLLWTEEDGPGECPSVLHLLPADEGEEGNSVSLTPWGLAKPAHFSVSKDHDVGQCVLRTSANKGGEKLAARAPSCCSSCPAAHAAAPCSSETTYQEK